jgi:hypothetical protein
MPSILKTKARRVLRYLNKYGFNNLKLTIYIMNINSSLEEVVALEQYFIDTLKPNLNVDLVANGSGKNLEFSSLTSLANYLKGDRATIRQYLKGEKLSYYRGIWKFTYKK